MIILLVEAKPRTYFERKTPNQKVQNKKSNFEDKQELKNNQSPLENRLKRNIFMKKYHEHHNRKRRQTVPFRGRFRGQTQSQYLSVSEGGQKDGKAEAEATQQSSHAVVSMYIF